MKKEGWENLKYLPSDWAVARVASLPLKLLNEVDLSSLQALLSESEFREILRTSSPEFYQRFIGKEFRGTDQDLLHAFIKYLLRSSVNPIPRKIFAGYNVVQIGANSGLKILNLKDWECQLIDSSSKKTSKYYYNSFIYFKKNELRYKIFDSEVRSWHDASIRLNRSDLKKYKEIIFNDSKCFTKSEFFKNNKKFKSQLENIWQFFEENQIVYRYFKKDFLQEKSIKFSQLTGIENIEEQHDWELHATFDSESGLPEKFVQKLSSATTTLIRLFQREHQLQFQNSFFGQYFIEKMQDPDIEEVPLLQALDAQTKYFYRRNIDEFKKIDITSEVTEDIKYKISKAIGLNQKNVIFSKEEVEILLQKSSKQFDQKPELNFYPQSLSVFCEIGPDLTPVLKRVNGGSFYSAIGKYANYNSLIEKHCIDFLESHVGCKNDEFVYAIVSCDAKVVQINSVLSSSRLNIYRICINRPCENEMDIPLSDIYLKTSPMGLFIRSRKLKKQIKILNSSLIGDGIVENSAFDFLKQLGQFDSFNNVDPLPINLIQYGYVPRITFPSAIVHVETWRVFKSQQKRIQTLSNQELNLHFEKLGLPSQFYLADATSGSRLFIDLKRPELIKLLRSFLTGSLDLDFEEIIDEQQATHTCDFIVPLYRSPRQQEPCMYSSVELEQNSDIAFLGPTDLQIEEGVVSYEIYLEKTKEHEFIGSHFSRALFRFKKKYPSVKYFFIRYWDERDGFHIRIRFLNENSNLLVKLNSDFIQILQKWKKQDWVDFYKVVPFRPEYFRYYGQRGIQTYLKDSIFQTELVLGRFGSVLGSNFENRLSLAYVMTKEYLSGLNLSNDELQKLILKQLNIHGHKNSDHEILNSKDEKMKLVDLKHLKVHLSALFKSLRFLPELERQNFVLSLLHLLNNRLGLPVRFDSVILRYFLKDLRRSEGIQNDKPKI